MTKTVYLLFVLSLFAGFVYAQQDLDMAQERAMAVRAARMDAMRQLGEAIKGVRITSSTTVNNFVTESDQINASYQGFIQGAQQVGDPRLLPDGTCEVTLSIAIDQVILGLQTVWYQHSDSRTVTSPEQFEQIRGQYEPNKVFTATGSGAMKTSPPPAPTGENIWLRVSPRGKLMALRAAKMDAYRNMAETLQGVKIDSETKVKDFVTESDIITGSFNGFVQGVEFVGEPKYLPEGVVEVTAQVDLGKLSQFLANTCREKYQGNKWTPERFQTIPNYNNARVVKTSGSGAPPKNTIGGAPINNNPPVVVNPDTNTNPVPVPVPVQPPVTVYVPEWAQRTVKVTGMGAMPQGMSQSEGKVLSRRAAILDAYRQLAEQIMGLQLKSSTNVKDFVTQSDEINTQVETFIRGARVLEIKDLQDGTSEATMELYLGDMWQLIAERYYQKYGKY